MTNRIVPSKNRAFIRVEKGNSLWGYFGWNGDAFDTFIQPDETFAVNLQTPVSATIADNQAAISRRQCQTMASRASDIATV